MRTTRVTRLLPFAILSTLAGCGGGPEPRREALVERSRLDSELRQMCDALVDDLLAQEKAGALRQRLHYLKIGVPPFHENGERPRVRKLGRLVADELMVCLVDRHRLQLVERSRASDVDTERLQAAFFEDEAAVAALGEHVGADLMVLGSVADADDLFMINLRVARVRGGQIIVAQSTSLPADPLVDRSLHLFDRKSKWDASARSALLPGWGQFYNDQPVKAAGFLATELALLGAALGFELKGRAAEARYDVPRRDTVPDRQVAIESYETRNVLLLIAGAGWAAGVVDAWINGYEYSPDLLRPSVGLGPLGVSLGFQF